MDSATVNLTFGAPAVLGLAVILLCVVRDHRTLLPIVWFCTICFVPVWVGVNDSGLYVSGAVACAIVLVVVLTFVPSATPIQWTGADLWIGAFFLACLFPIAIPASNSVIVMTTLSEWVPGFLLGRLMAAKVPVPVIYRVAAAAFGVAALLGVIEFVTHWNPFVEIHRANALFATWGGLQERGGILRAEGAFGHSIAFGCSLALAVPLLLGGRLRGQWKLIGLTLIGGAALVSFSRAGMLATAIAVVLSLLFLRKENTFGLRTVITLAACALVLAAAPFVTSVFAQAGEEAAGSAEYRGDLVSLLPDMAPMGLSPSHTDVAGSSTFGGFQSIDDTVILIGLRYGWIPMVITVGIMLSAVVALLRRRATPPLVALVALIPAMVSVSLITQFGILVWFFVGMAATQQAQRSANEAIEHAAALRGQSYYRTVVNEPLNVSDSVNPAAMRV